METEKIKIAINKAKNNQMKDCIFIEDWKKILVLAQKNSQNDIREFKESPTVKSIQAIIKDWEEVKEMKIKDFQKSDYCCIGLDIVVWSFLNSFEVEELDDEYKKIPLFQLIGIERGNLKKYRLKITKEEYEKIRCSLEDLHARLNFACKGFIGEILN